VISLAKTITIRGDILKRGLPDVEKSIYSRQVQDAITVFIDEGGDPGVKDGLRFADSRYEWFTLGAYVIRSENDAKAVDTVGHILDLLKGGQRPALHYAQLPAGIRKPACEYLASVPARAFCVLSHKTNLREYTNPILGQLKAGEYYNWCTRLLLERIMYWYAGQIRAGAVRKAPFRIVFSEKGGHDYDHMFSYLERLIDQARTKGHKLRAKHFDAEMLDRALWHIEPDDKLAGLQLADVVASAFYQAANRKSPNWNVEPALALSPIVGSDSRGSARDVGVTVWPLSHQGKLPEDSWPIFQKYGYRF